jgi:hypothetical protein
MAYKVYENPHAAQTVDDSSAAAAPTDADFEHTPPNGTIIVGNDGTSDCIFARVNGLWKKATLA